ncbi:condensation domain-containing protein [Streptomyces sp. NPDC048304]|uniref:condensation domain-containing protein n=1 Tax=Streptomyces sp. NPDC048304 TaxID=3154820 RepID=UPI0033C78845
MTANHTWPLPPEEATTVVVELGRPPHRETALELCGPLDRARIEAALAHVAAHAPAARAWYHRIDRHGPRHHTLRLAAADAGTPADTYPCGLLADLLTHPEPAAHPAQRIRPTPLQRELLAAADAHPGRYVGQLAWSWHGPLDTDRFRASWQCVTDRESVLRTAFDDGPEPLLAVHEHATADVLCLPAGAAHWDDLVEDDRRRGIDPRSPGALRVTVLAGDRRAPYGTAPARVLLTYHHALLDDFSARLLLREFYRAYVAGGRLPGGERRPDLRDYTGWLSRQDTGPARDLWARTARTRTTAALPVPPAATGPMGRADAAAERVRLRLTADQTERLRAWAVRGGVTESVALYAVWAVLLYRAQGAGDVAPVRFGIGVRGRGILLDGVEHLPAALSTSLPLRVEVDPRSTVATLLTEVRDRVLDLTAYEWVSPGQVRSWAGAEGLTGAEENGSLLVFEHRPRDPDALTADLAAEGIHVEPPETLGALTAFPLTLAAHHDEDDSLVLTVTYDPSRLTGATGILSASALLLDELPYTAGDSTTIADVLHLLSTAESTGPAVAVRPPSSRADGEPPTAAEPPLEPLRAAAAPGAGTICLVHSRGIPRSCYDRLARTYRGPEAMVLLHPGPGGIHARHPALRRLSDTARLVVVGGFSGGGSAVYETARLIASSGDRPPLLVLTSAAAEPSGLARMLETAAAQARRT